MVQGIVGGREAGVARARQARRPERLQPVAVRESENPQGVVGLRLQNSVRRPGGCKVADGELSVMPRAIKFAGVAVNALDDGVDLRAGLMHAQGPDVLTLGAVDGDLPDAGDVRRFGRGREERGILLRGERHGVAVAAEGAGQRAVLHCGIVSVRVLVEVQDQTPAGEAATREGDFRGPLSSAPPTASPEPVICSVKGTALPVHLRKAVPKAVRRRLRGSGVQGHTEQQRGQESADSGGAESCTGPETDCRRIIEPLLASLLRQGKIRPDPLFLGLRTSDDGPVIDRDGEASTLILTLGPLRKGSL